MVVRRKRRVKQYESKKSSFRARESGKRVKGTYKGEKFIGRVIVGLNGGRRRDGRQESGKIRKLPHGTGALDALHALLVSVTESLQCANEICVGPFKGRQSR